MARDPDRREPRQARSKDTAAAIVEAADRVFTEMGLERATTNRIAEVAGVSVGSLYQYYPNKQALLTALYERESARVLETFLRLVEEVGTDDVYRLLRAFIHETVGLFEERAPLYQMLLDEVPRFAGLDATHAIDQQASAAVRYLLARASDRHTLPDVDVAAGLIVRTYRYNTLALLKEPLAPEQREVFIDELTTMLTTYLLGERTARRG